MTIIQDFFLPVAQNYAQSYIANRFAPSNNPIVPDVIEQIYNPSVNTPEPTAAAGTAANGRYYVYDSKTGTFRPKRRRRRRRMLTCGDREDLMFAQTLKANEATKQLLARCQK
ncbi:MAG: hypothetical protein HKN35_15985 [Woeseia sp.]|nr:hypothetical protein [Woeseia sp.]